MGIVLNRHTKLGDIAEGDLVASSPRGGPGLPATPDLKSGKMRSAPPVSNSPATFDGLYFDGRF